MARLYADENVPRPLVDRLRDLGHDVLTVQENDRGSQAVPDPEVLADAVLAKRAVLTLNRRDFIALHQRSDAHHGVVVCSVDIDYGGLAGRVDRAIRAESLRGKLIRVNRPHAP